MASEFCQHTVGSRRCVLRVHAEGYNHELQPRSAASVRMIERQEEREKKLSPETVVAALDEAIGSAPAPESLAAPTRISAISTSTSAVPAGETASESSTST